MMEMPIVVSTLIAVMIQIVTYIVSAHSFNKSGLIMSFSIGTGFAFLLILIKRNYTLPMAYEFYGHFILATIAYLSLTFCFWVIINLNRTSLRVRILDELLEYNGKEITIDELYLLYHPTEISKRRIERLIKKKHLMKNNGRLTISKPHLIIISLIIRWFRYVIIPQK